MTDLNFVQTADLVDELMSRFDVAIFAAGKEIKGHWTTYNQWESKCGPHSVIGLTEQFKFELMTALKEESKPIEGDEPE